MTNFLQILTFLIVAISGVSASNNSNITCFEDQLIYNNICYDLDNLLISNNKTYYLANDFNNFDFNNFDYQNVNQFKFEMISNQVISDNLNVLPAINIMLPVSDKQYIIKPILQ